MTTVRQLLNEKGHTVYAVGPDETVFDAIRKMADENIGSLVVCEGTKPVGIITERHYARNVFLKGRSSPRHARARSYGNPGFVRSARAISR